MRYQMEKCQRTNQFYTKTLNYLEIDLIYAHQQIYSLAI